METYNNNTKHLMGIFFKRLFATIMGIVVALLLLIIAIVVACSLLFSDILTSPAVEMDKGTVLEISMNDMIVDSPSDSPLDILRPLGGGGGGVVSLFDLSMAVEAAAADGKVVAISLRMDGAESLSLAQAAELRSLLLSYREMSGKPIYAYAEGYSQAEYYVASIADHISLHPEGSVEWSGVSANSLYFGALLDELGIKAEVFRPESCDYKSAVEIYTSSSMSRYSRTQNQRLVTGFWDGILSEVSSARGISGEELRRAAAEQIILDGAQAEELRMVDALQYRDEYDAELKSEGVVEDRKSHKLRTISMSKYASHVAQTMAAANAERGNKGNKIALIYVDGVIVDGDVASSSSDDVVSGVVARQLRRARLDDDVRAVVVRVNSPGGSAMAADVIWREMELVREAKPLIVSFGAYAASGGYYMSAPADMILTSPYTLTGSIGVYGVLFAYEDALRERLKIAMDGVVSSPSADFGRVAREVTPVERAALMRGVDGVYEKFCSCVAQGRHISAERVESLSGGRVWSGAEAVRYGLADKMGGLRDALIVAADRCGMKSGAIEIVEYSDGYDDWEAMLSDLFMGVSLRGMLTPSAASVAQETAAILERERGVMMLNHERIEF